MNREIILRVRAPDGQYRINIMSRDTYGELLLQVIIHTHSLQKNSTSPSKISLSQEKMENSSPSAKATKLETSPTSLMEPFSRSTPEILKNKLSSMVLRLAILSTT